jgi:hypothetical protein
MWKLILGYGNHIEYIWEHQISKVWNPDPSLPPFSPKGKKVEPMCMLPHIIWWEGFQSLIVLVNIFGLG